MDKETRIYSLILKNQLLGVDTDLLKDMYKQEKYFKKLLTTLKMLIEQEPEFFWLEPEVISKSYKILKDSNYIKIYLEEINDIIINLNGINATNMEEKNIRLTSYLSKQLKMREIDYNIDIDTLKNLISYDCIVYKFIDQNIEMRISVDFVCSSINYFSEYIPETFDDDRKIDNINMLIESALGVLEHEDLKGKYRKFKKEYKKKILMTKSKVEKTIKRYQKVKIKNNS